MIRFYSLFVTDNELLASPYVRRFNVFHDLTLTKGRAETVNFLLQTTVTPEQEQRLNVIFDPSALKINKVEVKAFNHQTLITVTLTPLEIGSVRIGFSVPQSDPLHKASLSKIQSPMTTVPCVQLRERAPLISQRRHLVT